VWRILASYQHHWTPTWLSAVTFDYFNQNPLDGYRVAGNVVWMPSPGFFGGVEGSYSRNSDEVFGSWGVKIRLQRTFAVP
jgi:hypothetical protein